MKYHPFELQQMAVQFLMHQSNNDSRCEEVIAKLQDRLGIDRETALVGIHQLAMVAPVAFNFA